MHRPVSPDWVGESGASRFAVKASIAAMTPIALKTRKTDPRNTRLGKSR